MAKKRDNGEQTDEQAQNMQPEPEAAPQDSAESVQDQEHDHSPTGFDTKGGGGDGDSIGGDNVADGGIAHAGKTQ